jgi:hypothetical protein
MEDHRFLNHAGRNEDQVRCDQIQFVVESFPVNITPGSEDRELNRPKVAFALPVYMPVIAAAALKCSPKCAPQG